MERLLTSSVSVSSGYQQYPIGKSIFAIHLPLKLFRATVAICKCWHWKSEASPYMIWYVFGLHAAEIWTKSYSLKCTKFKLWEKNRVVLKPILTKHCHHFVRRFCGWSNCLMANYQFSDYHISVFQKLW